jgi:hypothetical protein
MTETSTKPTPTDAEQRAANKAKLDKLERIEQAEADSAAEIKAATARQAAQAKGETALVDKAIAMDALKGLMPQKHFVKLVNSVWAHYAVKVPAGTPIDFALGRTWLYPVHDKFVKGSNGEPPLITLYDEAFRWEVNVRLLKVDKALNLVYLSKVGEITYHDMKAAIGVDLDSLEFKHRGAVHRWSVIDPTGANGKEIVLQSGFGTEDEAKSWVESRKRA